MKNINWTRDELILAFSLYCKTPFSKIGSSDKGIKELAPLIDRSVSAVALKLANFARLDPALQKRNISGMSHGSKGEARIWEEFNENWEELVWQSEQILAGYKNDSIENVSDISIDDLPIEGKEREAIVKIRVNQSFFRKTILASYNQSCCITGMSISDLLVASHIIPWSKDEINRVNPANGLCLNSLHDKAFDAGLITITPEYVIKLSDSLLSNKNEEVLQFFIPYKDKKMRLPQKFYPTKEFLNWHNENVFTKK